MRGKSSSKQGSSKAGGMEIDNKLDNKLKEELHLSGAYIRSLVKQLTSTRTKDPINSKDHQCLHGDGTSGHQQTTRSGGGGLCDQPQQHSQQPPPAQHKKQVRRRLHTSRPYQERLLNMAEARREIVTALKFHRAAMKQQQQQQQQEEQQKQREEESEFQEPLQPMQELALEQEGKSKSRRNPRIYASQRMNNFGGYGDNAFNSAFVCPPNHNHPYSWSLPLPPPPVAPPLLPENLNFALPNQTLGLNLNLQDFSNLDSCFYQSVTNPSNFSATSFSSTSSSPPVSVEVPCHEAKEGCPPLMAANAQSSLMNYGDSDLHHAVDDKEMAEIRSIGEQHQMEWNDTLNFVTSACWFKFLKAMEIDPEEKADEEFGHHHHPFDEVMEFPSWLNANESCLEQHLNDYCSDDYMQDPALPCMEIEEIEGMDGEWLS